MNKEQRDALKEKIEEFDDRERRIAIIKEIFRQCEGSSHCMHLKDMTDFLRECAPEESVMLAVVALRPILQAILERDIKAIQELRPEL